MVTLRQRSDTHVLLSAGVYILKAKEACVNPIHGGALQLASADVQTFFALAGTREWRGGLREAARESSCIFVATSRWRASPAEEFS